MVLRKLNIHFLQGIILLFMIALTLVAIGPLRQLAHGRAEWIKNNLLERFEQDTGVSLSYDSISPSLLSVVTVHNLKVLFAGGDFTASRFRVYLNPFNRAKNNSYLSRLITHVTISSGYINLKLDSGAKNPPNFQRFLPYWNTTAVVLKDFTARIEHDTVGVLEARIALLELAGSGDAVRYGFNGTLMSERLTTLFQSGDVRLAMKSSGIFNPIETSFNGRIDLAASAVGAVRIEPVSVNLGYKEKKLVLERVGDARPVDMTVTFSDDGIEAVGKVENLQIEDIFRIEGDFTEVQPWFTSTADGEFRVLFQQDSRRLSYDLDMALSLPENTVLPWPWGIRANLSGNQREADIDELAVTLPWGTAEYSGRVRLEELAMDGDFFLTLSDELLGYPVDSRFVVSTIDGVITGEPVYAAAGELDFQDFSFLVIQEDKQYSLSIVVIPEETAVAARQSILLDVMVNLADEPTLYSFVKVNGLKVDNIANLLNIPYPTGSSFVHGTLFNLSGFFEANTKAWIFSFDDAALVDIDNPDNNITLNGRIMQDRWSLDSLRIDWNGYAVDGSCYALNSAEGGIAKGRFVIGEEIYPLEGEWIHSGPLRIFSPSGLDIVLGSPVAIGRRSLAIKGSQMLIPLKNESILADFDVRGIVGKNNWQVSLKNSRFIRRREGGFQTALELAGELTPESLDFPIVHISDSIGELNGYASFKRLIGSSSFIGSLVLNSDTDESYSVYGERRGNYWDVQLSVNAGRLDRLGIMNAQGYLDLKGNFSGTVANPALTLEVSTREGFLNSSSFMLQGKATLNSSALKIHDIHVLYEGISIERGLVLLSLDKGVLQSTAELSATYNQVPVSSGFAVAVDFKDKISLLNIGSLAGRDFSGTLNTRAILWNSKPHLPPFAFSFEKNSTLLTIQSPDKEILDVSYSFINNQLDIVSGAPMPIIARGGGTIRGASLDLKFPQLDIDPVLINYVMLRDPILLQYHVIFQSGRLVGNLNIQGPASSPDLYGEIQAVNLKVDTPYTYADIKPTGSIITFAGNKISFSQTVVPVGKGVAYGEGYIVLDGWKLTETDMVFGCQAVGGGEGVPASYPLIGIYLDGQVAGEIRMTGSYQGLFLTGDITVPYLKVSLGSPRIPVSQRKPGKRPKSIILDFRIHTGTNCTFYLPNEQLKIVKATAEPGRTLNLLYNNYPKELSLTGTIPIQSGDINYLDRSFQITEGAMVFNEALKDFDPVMQLRAETRVRDDNNDEVTIALIYDAPVKSDFNPKIETNPVRSEIEILALLGQVATPDIVEGVSDPRSVLLATSGMFAQAGLVQPFEEILREGLNLDLVTIQTDIIENALADSLNWNSINSGTSQMPGLARYFDNTRLFVGKYIGKALFASGSVSARYLEGPLFQSVFGGLEFETAISLEMATPFFNIQWSYSPNPVLSQNFIENNEITLKWQFSY